MSWLHGTEESTLIYCIQMLFRSLYPSCPHSLYYYYSTLFLYSHDLSFVRRMHNLQAKIWCSTVAQNIYQSKFECCSGMIGIFKKSHICVLANLTSRKKILLKCIYSLRGNS